MKICLDTSLCSGYAVCESVSDDLFEVEGQGPTRVLVDEIPDEFVEDARHAVDSCPTGALSLGADA